MSETLLSNFNHLDSEYDDLPVAICVEDFSAVKKLIEGLREAGVKDFRAYFETHLDVVAQSAALVKIVSVNQECLRFLGVEKKADIPQYLSAFFDQDSLPAFCKELVFLAEGQLRFDVDFPIRDLQHRVKYIQFGLSVAAGFEDTFERVLVSLINITERRQAENSLRESNARLEAIFDLSGIAIAITDLNGEWMRWNHAFERLIGYSEAEIVHLNNMDLSHPEDRQLSADNQQALLAGKIPSYRIEKRYLHKNGEFVWTDLSVIPIKNGQGEILSVLGAGMEITERKRTEEALRESAATLGAIFNNSNDAIGVSLNGKHVLANPAYLEMYGYSLEELLTKKVADLIAPNSRAAIQENIRRRAAGEDFSLSYETRGLRKDGSEFDMDVRVSLYHLHGDQYTLVIIRDITSHKRAEEILRRNEQRLRQAEQIANIGSWELDVTSGKSHWSEQFYRICGYEPDAFEPTPEICERLTHPEDRDLAAAVLADAIAGSGRYTIEKRLVRADESTVWVESHGVIEYDAQGQPVKISRTILDINERKNAEEALRKSEDIFHQLAENMHEVLWVRDFHTRKVEYINPSYERIWGRTRQSLYDHPESFALSTHPEDRERVNRAVRLQYEGVPFNVESRIVHPDGTIRWIWARSNLAYSSEGHPYRLIGVAEDITERKEKEQITEIEGRRLTSLLKISQRAFSSVQDLMDFAVDEVALLSDSSYGFVIYYDPSSLTFTQHSVTSQARKDTQCFVPPLSFWNEPDSMVWKVIQEKKAVIYNDPQSIPQRAAQFPEGHVPLNRFMIVPVTKNDQPYAVVGLANKESDYIGLEAAQTDLMMQEVVKIIDRRLAADRLESSLEEKKALLKEIHHRVKNNMQVMISLIQMQASQVEDEATRSMLYECKDRIYSMALVHEQLYGSTSLSHIRFGDYVERLVYDLYSAHNVSMAVRLDLHADPVTLPIETAIPCGLLINEMITNAFKHAFPAGRGGTVHVDLSEDSGQILLTVSDDGIGIPARILPERSESLGLKLIHLLARQVDGHLALNRQNGTTYTLSLKALPGPSVA